MVLQWLSTRDMLYAVKLRLAVSFSFPETRGHFRKPAAIENVLDECYCYPDESAVEKSTKVLSAFFRCPNLDKKREGFERNGKKREEKRRKYLLI